MIRTNEDLNELDNILFAIDKIEYRLDGIVEHSSPISFNSDIKIIECKTWSQFALTFEQIS